MSSKLKLLNYGLTTILVLNSFTSWADSAAIQQAVTARTAANNHFYTELSKLDQPTPEAIEALKTKIITPATTGLEKAMKTTSEEQQATMKKENDKAIAANIEANLKKISNYDPKIPELKPEAVQAIRDQAKSDYQKIIKGDTSGVDATLKKAEIERQNAASKLTEKDLEKIKSSSSNKLPADFKMPKFPMLPSPIPSWDEIQKNAKKNSTKKGPNPSVSPTASPSPEAKSEPKPETALDGSGIEKELTFTPRKRR